MEKRRPWTYEEALAQLCSNSCDRHTFLFLKTVVHENFENVHEISRRYRRSERFSCSTNSGIVWIGPRLLSKLTSLYTPQKSILCGRKTKCGRKRGNSVLSSAPHCQPWVVRMQVGMLDYLRNDSRKTARSLSSLSVTCRSWLLLQFIPHQFFPRNSTLNGSFTITNSFWNYLSRKMIMERNIWEQWKRTRKITLLSSGTEAWARPSSPREDLKVSRKYAKIFISTSLFKLQDEQKLTRESERIRALMERESSEERGREERGTERESETGGSVKKTPLLPSARGNSEEKLTLPTGSWKCWRYASMSS